jgi:putative ABC transport system permease protein
MILIVSFVISTPAAYYVMDKWLQNFAYRIDIGVAVFLISGILLLLIAVLTVSFQTIKAATANPVKSLRYE